MRRAHAEKSNEHCLMFRDFVSTLDAPVLLHDKSTVYDWVRNAVQPEDKSHAPDTGMGRLAIRRADG